MIDRTRGDEGNEYNHWEMNVVDLPAKWIGLVEYPAIVSSIL